MNKVELMGRLTREVEVKTSSKNKDKKFSTFSLAVPRKLDKETTDFFECVSFGKVGEAIAKYCKTGTKIIVCGSIQIDTYTDKEGKARKATTIVVEDFYFTERNKEVTEDTVENRF